MRTAKHATLIRLSACLGLVAILGGLGLFLGVDAAPVNDKPQLTPSKGDKIVIIGNTLAERMQHRWPALGRLLPQTPASHGAEPSLRELFEGASKAAGKMP